ncbi:MAG: PASTA domain-containing protein [Solirubrobacterales bacterium]
MNAVIDRPPLGRRSLLVLAIGIAVFVSALTLIALRAQPSTAAAVTKPAVLLETAEAPWGEEFDLEAMETAFGTNWELQQFEDVQADEGAGGLFAPQVEFIWIEGSDVSTEAANEFVAAHEAQLKSFVARGGSLFINAGTNQSIAVEYDGRAIGHYEESYVETNEAEAVDPSEQIFNEPDPLGSTSFTGDAFASGDVTGATVTPLLVNSEEGSGNEGAVVLATYTSGLGHVALGTMTAAEFQKPEEDAKALRVNLLVYLKELASPGEESSQEETKVDSTQAASTTTTTVAQCVVPKLKGKTLKAAKAALTEAHCGLDKVAHKRSVSLKKGKVIRQRPVAGTVRGAGSEVSFRLGHG